VPIHLDRLENRPHQVHDSHIEIIEAIRSKDPVAASGLMALHIDLVESLVDKALAAAGIERPAR
jgi:DNA-binding GntR family transcriptional regulator